jgi:hypothetical protein
VPIDGVVLVLEQVRRLFVGEPVGVVQGGGHGLGEGGGWWGLTTSRAEAGYSDQEVDELKSAHDIGEPSVKSIATKTIGASVCIGPGPTSALSQRSVAKEQMGGCWCQEAVWAPRPAPFCLDDRLPFHFLIL